MLEHKLLDSVVDSGLKVSYENLVQSDFLLPIKVTEFYMKKVKEEIDAIGKDGPLYKSVIPTDDRIYLKANKESRDYVEEKKHMPIENCNYIIRKYNDRLVFLTTTSCVSHCQYCFRTYNLAEEVKNKYSSTIDEKLESLCKFLNLNEQINEVILSGGDPLTIQASYLEKIFKKITQQNIKNIRLHSRAIIYDPSILDDEMIYVLSKYNVRVVLHINHPYEICDSVEEKIKLMCNNKIRLYSQFPLLRGINDNYIVLKKLLTKMDELNIRPISIFIPDPIVYGASFRINYKRILQIINQLNWNTPSWINSTRFVMDTTIGKVRCENIVKWDKNCITFARDGKEIDYYDLDEQLDIQTDISKLLWKV
ncbi:MAG: 4Fe-4S cluster-binding domain-containing protein [Defluviitaleaceae bacterium]|nr:4Fe-4S cluster-binding domain-containing protein [Defluviitaleaceae bacterium]